MGVESRINHTYCKSFLYINSYNIDVRTAVDNINWSIKPEYTLAQLSNANEPSMKL